MTALETAGRTTTLLTGPGFSHAELMERPQEFTDLVLDFLREPVSA